MDAAITAAGLALRAGNPIGALDRVALRVDPAAVALRGIAMAQLGELRGALRLLRRAMRAFPPRAALERARCQTAAAEVALAARDLAWPAPALAAAVRVLAARGDRANLAHARLLQLRRLLLLGRVDAASRALAALPLAGAPSRLAAVAALLAFEIALRRGRSAAAREALARARDAAARAGIPALRAEVARAGAALALPAARLVARGEVTPLDLAGVERLLASPDLVVDGCCRVARRGSWALRLARRPVLFALLRGLAEAWPGEAPRAALLASAFGARRADASHRGRLRVELARLRRQLRPVAGIRATAGGFALLPRGGAVRVLAPPVESRNGAVVALLSDGEAWSTSALALALGASQRSAQRALGGLEEAGEVRALGRGRSRRWVAAPVAGFATALLLPDTGGLDGGPGAPAATAPGRPAEILRELGPYPDAPQVHGVTFDGRRVWFASGARLHAVDPGTGRTVRSLEVPCDAGTAFDGRHLFQLARDRIQRVDPATGAVLGTIPAPGSGSSGLAWAEGTLWVGQYGDRKIHQVDPETGAVLRTIASDRFVTGVTWVDGELWHGTWEGDASDLRRVDPATGAVLERLVMPAGAVVSGLESDGADVLWAGGGPGGRLRAVRRPRRRAAR